jgi:hypothetical protein
MLLCTDRSRAVSYDYVFAHGFLPLLVYDRLVRAALDAGRRFCRVTGAKLALLHDAVFAGHDRAVRAYEHARVAADAFLLIDRDQAVLLAQCPEMQLLTQSGSEQWRHETAKLTELSPSMRMRGLIVMPFNALIILVSPELAKAQKYSQRWQPKHHFSFT